MPISNIVNEDYERLGWDELAKRAKQLENDLDSKLLTLGRLTSAALRSQRYENIQNGIGESPLKQAETLSKDIAGGLSKLNGLIEALAARSEDFTSGSNLHIIQRHRDIFQEYSKDFRKTKEHLANAKEHAELISSVREEISSSHGGASKSNDLHSHLLAERSRIDSAHNATDHVLSIAYTTQNGMYQQRGLLDGLGRKMQGAAERFPIVNQIMMKVRVRRNRETIIFATVVGILLIITYFMFKGK